MESKKANEPIKLTRELKIAMLRSLQNGEVSEADHKTLYRHFVGEPLTLRLIARKEDLEEIENEVPDIEEL